MTFKEWINEIEVFSLRSERLYYDFPQLENLDRLYQWLEAAYTAGQQSKINDENLIDDQLLQDIRQWHQNVTWRFEIGEYDRNDGVVAFDFLGDLLKIISSWAQKEKTHD